ncbi:MAG: hypothetical protein PHV37_04660 [Candidatus Gastranaerophilales bacterium]|nr:hypothetical protein [Candidatus Gastranaerophilales bacterium]
MQISNNNAQSVSFGRIKNEYKTSDMIAREAIRGQIEGHCDASYEFSEQLGSMTKAEIMLKMRQKAATQDKITTDDSNTSTEVDVERLSKEGIYAFSERIKNKLYSGQCLENKPDQIKALKESGIKTVLALVPSDEYKNVVEKEGLNYVQLHNIGKQQLRVLSSDAFIELANRPELYGKNSSNAINDLKEYVNILNGENEKTPYPIYMGCQWGTDRTFEWYTAYKILKDAPQDKPLSTDRVKQLSDLIEMMEDHKRW